MTRAPLMVCALAAVVLLMTISDVASAQTGTAGIVAVSNVQSVVSPIAVKPGGRGPQRIVAIPQKAALRSPYQPPSPTLGPPPWAGRPDWAPGPPPWASNNGNRYGNGNASSNAKKAGR